MRQTHLLVRQLQNPVGTAFHRRSRLATERQPYRLHEVLQLPLVFALAAGLVAGCAGTAERENGLRAEAVRKLPVLPTLAERPVKADAWFMGAGHRRLRLRRLDGVRREDGGLAFTVRREELTPDVVDVEIHADVARAEKGDAGYALAQRGLVFDFNRDDFTWIQHRGWIYMPYYAMKTAKDAFVAVLEGMRFEHDLLLLARNGRYEMFPRWRISEIGSAPYEDMTVVFYQLPLEADYNQMAKVYRSYKFAHDPTVRTLRERIAVRPHLAKLAKSIALRQTHAGKPWKLPESDRDFTPADEPPVRTHCTFDRTLELLRELKAAGVDDVALCVAGWQTGGYDGRCPATFPVEAGPGGEEGLKRLIKGGQSLGYIIDGHSNYTDCFSCSPMWNGGEIACKKPDGSLFTNGAWSGGKAHNLCLKHAWETFLPADLEKIAALGFHGAHYIDVFTAVQPYRCCDPKHPANTKEQAAVQAEVVKRCHELFGGFASECSVDHLLGCVDYINYVSAPMRGKRQAEAKGRRSSVDRFVPFFELAFHDVVLSNPDKITQEVLKQPENLILVEYGGRPIFYSFNDRNLPGIRKAWDQFVKLRHLQLEEMVEHKILVEGPGLVDGLVRVTYANGERIYVNHTDRALAADGITVPAQDFVLRR